jgi:hypothetical protein
MIIMNEDSNDNVNTTADITPVEFKWDETNTTVGIIAQEICNIGIDPYTGSNSGLSIGSIGPLTYANGSTISFANMSSSDAFNAGTTEYGKTTIKTAKNTIDIDELADMMETLKKRLLILAPKFEMHEKYPMLKQMYDEYKAMEALLSGPDNNE